MRRVRFLSHDMISASNLPPIPLSNFELGGCATCRVKNGNINANTTEKGIQLVTVKAVVVVRTKREQNILDA